jgi:hypothetical protein
MGSGLNWLRFVSVAGFGTSDVELSGYAAAVLVRWILGREVVRMGSGFNWLRFVSSGGLWY